MLKTTYREKLWEAAADHFGYVTTQDAIELGVPPKELPKLVQHGGLKHIAYGLYRFEQFPSTELDQYAEAVLRVGNDAYLTGETVLMFHNLTPLAPKNLKVGVRRRTRAKVPRWIVVRQEAVTENDLTTYEGIPGKKVAKALLDCVPTMMAQRIAEATRVAREKGLITKEEELTVVKELEGAK